MEIPFEPIEETLVTEDSPSVPPCSEKEYLSFFSTQEKQLILFAIFDPSIPEEVTSCYKSLKQKNSKKAKSLVKRYEAFLQKVEEHNAEVNYLNELIDSFDTFAFIENPRGLRKERRKILVDGLNRLLSFSFETDQRIAGFLYCGSLLEHHFDEFVLQRDILKSMEKNLSDIDSYDGYITPAFALDALSKEKIYQGLIECMEEKYYDFDKLLPVEEAISQHNQIYCSDHPDFVPPAEE